MYLRACKEIECIASGDWLGHRDRRGELRGLTMFAWGAAAGLQAAHWRRGIPERERIWVGVDRGKLSSVLNIIKGSLLDIQETVSRRWSRTRGELWAGIWKVFGVERGWENLRVGGVGVHVSSPSHPSHYLICRSETKQRPKVILSFFHI